MSSAYFEEFPTIYAVILAGLGFVAFELFLSYGPPHKWLKLGFKANPKLRVDQIDECIRQAKSRLVGSLHLLIQIPLALWVMGTPEVNANRLLAKTPASMLMLCISAGYFLYDAAVSILRYEGIAYLMHGMVACVLYTYGALTGFLGYYGAAFLMWEVSTPFVYMRWFLFTLGKSQTKAYIINGLLMVFTFFVFRNIMGVAMSINFWHVSGKELAHPTSDLLPAVLWMYRLSCVSLNCLNAMWFYKMAKGAVKVLSGPKGAADKVQGDATVRVAATDAPAKKVS
ncbi:g11638 [Coccomyxa elongata]